MLHFITGRHGSGKSLLAERMAGDLGKRVTYVGTLPRHPAYEDVIAEHRRRRPDDWQIIELIGDGEVDIQTLRASWAHSDVILIDGLSFYLFRMLTFGIDLRALRRLGLPLLWSWGQEPCQVLIVDSPVPGGLPSRARSILRYAHALVLRAASTVTFVHSGRGFRVRRRFVLGLDRVYDTSPQDWRLAPLIKEV